MNNIVYFDLETQKSASEVGGWRHKDKMLMSVGVTYSTAAGQYRIYDEVHVNDLVKELMRADLVVGFNVVNFDYEVLHGYTALDLNGAPTLDLMADLEKKLGHRIGQRGAEPGCDDHAGAVTARCRCRSHPSVPPPSRAGPCERRPACRW